MITYLVRLKTHNLQYAVSGGYFYQLQPDAEKATRFQTSTAASCFIVGRNLEGIAEVVRRSESGKLETL